MGCTCFLSQGSRGAVPQMSLEQVLFWGMCYLRRHRLGTGPCPQTHTGENRVWRSSWGHLPSAGNPEGRRDRQEMEKGRGSTLISGLQVTRGPFTSARLENLLALLSQMCIGEGCSDLGDRGARPEQRHRKRTLCSVACYFH